MPEYILTEERDKIFIITMNRPEKRNAFNNQMWQEFSDALVYFDENDALWVAIITNKGVSFSAGSDIKELADGTHTPPKGREEWGFAGITRHSYSKPIIAAVNGSAVGGGLELMMACDLAIATQDSVFGLPETKIGSIAESGILYISRHMPLKLAKEMAYIGDPISAEKAIHYGLINQVVKNEEDLMPAAILMAEKICEASPLAVRASKAIIDKCESMDINYPSEAWRICDKYCAEIRNTEDSKEGKLAFVEKRKPRWKAR